MRSNLAAGHERSRHQTNLLNEGFGRHTYQQNEMKRVLERVPTILDLSGALPSRRPIQEVFRNVTVTLVVISVRT